jgi:hypothetical protein
MVSVARRVMGEPRQQTPWPELVYSRKESGAPRPPAPSVSVPLDRAHQPVDERTLAEALDLPPKPKAYLPGPCGFELGGFWPGPFGFGEFGLLGFWLGALGFWSGLSGLLLGLVFSGLGLAFGDWPG